MKIQIDTIQKTIKLETNENLGELFRLLEQLLPNDLWKEFSIETNTTISWTSPIIWREVVPYNPYPTPWITYCSNETYLMNPGTYNIDAYPKLTT